ncbi:MAG: hypothetical protein IPN34_12670 [Planctomycetes bacterium]|nr:hypothetical protein [Planctomycetota bacterium]
MSIRCTPSFRLALSCAAATVLAPAAFSQGLLPWNGQVIATNGDAVPGVPGAVFGGSSALDSGVLDDAGRVFFRGRMTGGGSTSLDERALFVGTSRADLQLVIRSGALEPTGTIPGATLNTATGIGISGSNRISGTGLMLFGATLFDGNVTVTTANDTLFYVGTPGNWQILVREGDPAVGTTGATYSSTFSSPSQQTTGLNGLGRAFFLSNLMGGDVVGTTNNVGLFSGTPGNLTLVARKGDVAPGGEILAGVASGFVTQMNASGQIAFDVSFVVGSGTTPVDATNDRALWLYTPGLGVQQLVREGDATPIPGVTYNHATATSWSVNAGSTALDGNGGMLLRVDLQGPGVTNGVDDMAIVRVSPVGQQVIVRRGDVVPGFSGITFDTFNNVSVLTNDSGTVAFQASLRGAVTTADDSATFIGTAGNWTMVVREGDATLGGGTFGSPSGRSHLLNGAGQLLMTLDIAGGTNAGSCLWSWDPSLGLQPQVVTGDQIEVQPTVFKLYGSQGGIQFSNGDVRPLSFASDGTYTTRVNFNDSTSAIVKSRLGSLYAAPTSISTTSGGTQSLYLNAGGANAGNTYFVLGSVSGTTPGFHFGSVLVPLNPDSFTLITLTYPNVGPFGNTLGTLDANGRALSTITIPPLSPGAGLTIDWAYIALDNLLNPTMASQSEKLIATL